MKKIYLFLILAFLAPQFSSAQLIALIGFNGNAASNTDGFSFVAGEDIPAGTTIYFTDREYISATDAFNTGENLSSYTTPAGGILKGHVVMIRETGTSTNTFQLACTSGTGATCGSITFNTGSVAYSGNTTEEGIYLYTDTDNDPTNGITAVLAVIVNYGTLPNVAGDSPIVNHPNAIVVDGFPNGDYIDFEIPDRSLTVTKANIENTSNYNNGVGNGSTPLLSTVIFANPVLPVALVDFTAKKHSEEVALNWTTSSEIDNDYFIIERSTDAVKFESLGKVIGNGSTELMTNYIFIDERPFNGFNYYRLKQVDFDGSFEYSPLVAINFKDEYTGHIQMSPNPFSAEVKIKLSQPFQKEANFEIHDMTGRVVFSGTMAKDVLTQDINLSFIQSGVYMLQIGEGENVITQRIVKF